MEAIPVAAEEMVGASWADIHEPLLEDIIRRLPLRDYARSGAVCRRWRQVRKASSPGPQPPLLLVQASHAPFHTFHALSDGRFLRLPAFSLPPSEKRICPLSSSRGWLLVTANPNPRYWVGFSLLNPISGEVIEMQSPPPLVPQSLIHYPASHFALSAPPTGPSCTVLVSHGVLSTLRLHDQGGWTVHPGLWTNGLVVRHGKAYAIDGSQEANLRVLDLESASVSLLKMDSRQLPDWWRDLILDQRLFLLDSPEGVLLVLVGCFPPLGMPPEYLIEIFRADLQVMAWVRMRSLNDTVLFISEATSVSVPASTVGIRGNQLYLVIPSHFVYDGCTDDGWSDNCWRWLGYDLENGRVNYHKETAFANTHPLLWMMPSLP